MGSGARKHSIPTYGAMILHSSMKVVVIDAASNGGGLSLSYEVVVVAMVERGWHNIYYFTQNKCSIKLNCTVSVSDGEVV